MRIALPLFGSRVSPRCVIARDVLLATLQGAEVTSRETTALGIDDESDLVERLLELGVELLVCGGIRKEIEDELLANGIEVLNNVAGEAAEILDALRGGDLARGHGLRHPPVPEPDASSGTRTLPSVDCVACQARTCLDGAGCPVGLGGLANPWLRGQESRIFETGQDVSAEEDPKLCRIAELVHFGLGTGCERIGLAFCWELHKEVEVLATVLRRFFTVVPVCCRIGSAPATNGGGGPESVPCNPVAVARILNQAKTDLNVIAGLCLGCDVLFTRRSRAPVTTLFVKDRSLAHNPIGAIYTRYHLEDLTTGRGISRRVRSGRN